MIGLRQGKASDHHILTDLILSSAPLLLPYLFNGEQNARDYIFNASQQSDGQYSAVRHQVAVDASSVIACMTLWDNDLPASFHQKNLSSLRKFLTDEQIKHLLKSNAQIEKVFPGPSEEQLCIGHLAVQEHAKGRGIGKKLIAYAISQAKLRGKNQVVLDVDRDNEEALSFYQGLGFVMASSVEFLPTQQVFYRMHYQL
jgi:ribosomal protein S18 acetylase RimI-like enzyme